MDNQKLSDKVEALEGPNRDWDTEIARACGAEYGPKSGWCDNESGDYWTVENCAMHYTASLDSAMSLVPEDEDVAVRMEFGRGWGYASVGNGHPLAGPDANAATPALALCAAALKARGL